MRKPLASYPGADRDRRSSDLDRASHDLRNYLATILNGAEVLLRTVADDLHRADLQSVYQAALAAAELASQIEAGLRDATAERQVQTAASGKGGENAGGPDGGADDSIDALIVEDDRLLGDMFVRWLRLEGHRARLARDGQEALARMTEKRPDLLVVDYRLPDTDGLALLRRAGPLVDGVFVALVSGAVPPSAPGVDVVLAKPVRPRVWREVILRALDAGQRRPTAHRDAPSG